MSVAQPSSSTEHLQPMVNFLTFFKHDPTILVDKQFILEEGDNSILYEIVGVSFSKGAWKFQVCFEGCGNSVDVSGLEMEEMLKGSSLVEV
jgi:hypothetical protein